MVLNIMFVVTDVRTIDNFIKIKLDVNIVPWVI